MTGGAEPDVDLDLDDLAAEFIARRRNIGAPQADVDADGTRHAVWTAFRPPHPWSLTVEECETVIALCDADPRFREEQQDCCSGLAGCMRIVDDPGPFGWLVERLVRIVEGANRKWFNYDVAGLSKVTFKQYTPRAEDWEPPGHLCVAGIAAERGCLHHEFGARLFAHSDWGADNPMTKLSISVQLSDPADYEGADLEFFHGPHPDAAPRERGTVTIFPSFLVHQVSAMTSGTRWSANAFVTGSPFR